MKAKRHYVQLNLEIDARDTTSLSAMLYEAELICSILDRRHTRKYDEQPHEKPDVVKHILIGTADIDIPQEEYEQKAYQIHKWIDEHHKFQAGWNGHAIHKVETGELEDDEE